MRRILFLGQGPLGEACFSLALKANGVDVVAASSNLGTANWWKSNAIWKEMTSRNRDFIDNSDRNNEAVKATIERNNVDTIISVQHNWIIPNEVIQLVDGMAFNLHMAKLPEYKGHHPFVHAILNGDKTYTVTMHWMTPKVDVGSIAFSKEFDIAEHDTAKSLYRCGVVESLKLFEKLIAALGSGAQVPAQPMTGEHRFYSRDSIRFLDRIENPTDTSEVDAKSRAFYFPPFAPAYIEHAGKKTFVFPESALADWRTVTDV